MTRLLGGSWPSLQEQVDQRKKGGGVFLNKEEATGLFVAARAFDELMTTSDELMAAGLPGYILELINQELRFVVNAEGGNVFEFQSGDDDRIKHLEKQKTRLEAEVKALKGAPSVH